MANTTREPDVQSGQLSDTPTAFNFSDWANLPLPAVPSRSSGREGIPEVGVGERIVAALAIVGLSPLMLLIALAIKIECPRGSIFYKQERVGLDRRRAADAPTSEDGADKRKQRGAGRPFRIWKFRTMIPDAELKTGPIWAAEDDPRITRLGKNLRLLHLDEIPQFFNILAGQMKLIGPRPEREHFIRQLSEEIPSYTERLKVFPGITGLAQVEREYDSDEDDVRTKLKYDLFYVNNRSRVLDIKILIKTLDVVIHRRGAH